MSIGEMCRIRVDTASAVFRNDRWLHLACVVCQGPAKSVAIYHICVILFSVSYVAFVAWSLGFGRYSNNVE